MCSTDQGWAGSSGHSVVFYETQRHISPQRNRRLQMRTKNTTDGGITSQDWPESQTAGAEALRYILDHDTDPWELWTEGFKEVSGHRAEWGAEGWKVTSMSERCFSLMKLRELFWPKVFLPLFLPSFSGCKIIKDFLSSVTLCVPQNPSINALNLGEMSFQGTGWKTNCDDAEMRSPSTSHPIHPGRILLPLSLVHRALGQAWVHPTACYQLGATEGVSTWPLQTWGRS